MFNDYRIGRHVLKRPKLMSFILMLLLVHIVLINQIAVSQQQNTNSKNMLYVGGTGNGNYSTIQEAINHALSGDIIFVYNGTYYENVLINKTIALIGEERNTTIIDANDNGGVITIHADNVSLNHFTIQNAGYHAKRRLACLGIIPGVDIIKKKAAPFHGPIEIIVKGSSLVIGRGLAAKIIVKQI